MAALMRSTKQPFWSNKRTFCWHWYMNWWIALHFASVFLFYFSFFSFHFTSFHSSNSKTRLLADITACVWQQTRCVHPMACIQALVYWTNLTQRVYSHLFFSHTIHWIFFILSFEIKDTTNTNPTPIRCNEENNVWFDLIRSLRPHVPIISSLYCDLTYLFFCCHYSIYLSMCHSLLHRSESSMKTN